MGRRYFQTESKMTGLTDWRVRKAVKEKEDFSGLDNLDCEKSPAYYYGSFFCGLKRVKNSLKQLKNLFFSPAQILNGGWGPRGGW